MSSTLDPTLALARELIARESVTPNDAGCQQVLAKHLADIGFACETLVYGEVENLWARIGDASPLFVFAGHTDVVPTGKLEDWRYPPFEPTVTDGYLYGRGAADMKGSLAAMVVATERFLRASPNPRGSIGFLITSDEEGPATDGTVKVVEHLTNCGQRIDFCLVGEPSSRETLGDVIRIGRRGSLGATLHVQGVQGHVAYPASVINPIHRFAPALAELAATEWDQGNADFPPTSFQVSNIRAGTGATNVVPGELEAQFNFRFSTEVTADDLTARTEALLDKHGLDYQIQWGLSGLPFLTHRGEFTQAVCEAIYATTGNNCELSTGGGTSDGRFIAPGGTQVVELGPINASIHKIDENVGVAELAQLASVYEHVLRRVFEAKT